EDVNLGAGVIKIGSVTSTAQATTNGTTASSTGRTVVHDMTIGGQHAYVDESGVHIGDQGQPANAVADEIANSALSGAGFKFFTSKPQSHQAGASADYTAASLYVLWQTSGGTWTYSFGGARVSVTSAPGFDFTLPGGEEVPGEITPLPDGSVTSPGEVGSSPSIASPSVGSSAAPSPGAAATAASSSPTRRVAS